MNLALNRVACVSGFRAYLFKREITKLMTRKESHASGKLHGQKGQSTDTVFLAALLDSFNNLIA